MSQIYLYGIAGYEAQLRVIRYELIDDENPSIRFIKHYADMMRFKNPTIKHVYAMDQRPGLRRDFVDAFKKNSIESWAIFKNILETEGLKII